jgi:hypothetical protein
LYCNVLDEWWRSVEYRPDVVRLYTQGSCGKPSLSLIHGQTLFQLLTAITTFAQLPLWITRFDNLFSLHLFTLLNLLWTRTMYSFNATTNFEYDLHDNDLYDCVFHFNCLSRFNRMVYYRLNYMHKSLDGISTGMSFLWLQ